MNRLDATLANVKKSGGKAFVSFIMGCDGGVEVSGRRRLECASLSVRPADAELHSCPARRYSPPRGLCTAFETMSGVALGQPRKT